MGVRILDGEEGACFYCSTTEWCFGPLMASREEARLFLDYIGKILCVDARELSDKDMVEAYSNFKSEFTCAYCGSFISNDEICYEGKDGRFCYSHRDKGTKRVWHEDLIWMDKEKKNLADHENEDCEPAECEYCKREKSENESKKPKN